MINDLSAKAHFAAACRSHRQSIMALIQETANALQDKDTALKSAAVCGQRQSFSGTTKFCFPMRRLDGPIISRQ